MIKRNKSISINIVSVFIILISLFIGVVGGTNAWFTAEHRNGVEIVVQVGALKLSLYQKIGATINTVYSYAENGVQADGDKKYITLSGMISPDEINNLHLYIANDDSKSVPVYLRYKFELYVRGEVQDENIPVTISGFTAWSGSQAGMKENTLDGFYYYTAADGNHALLNKNESLDLMTNFVVDYEDMVNTNGILKFKSSDAIYIKLIVEGSAIDWE